VRARARREDGSVRRFFCIVVVVVVVVVEKVRASPRKDSIRFDSIVHRFRDRVRFVESADGRGGGGGGDGGGE